MNSYLFTWNPKKWTWYDLKEAIVSVNTDGCYQEIWSSGKRKQIEVGEKFYMMRLGVEPKGIIGCGYVLTKPDLLEHWDPVKAKDKEKALRALLDFKVLSDEPIISLKELEKNYPDLKWTPESGGVYIPKEYADSICKTLEKRALVEFGKHKGDIPEFKEGRAKKVTITTYDRNPIARQKCIMKFGYNCHVCEFEFGNVYGKLGDKYIEVHHLKSISTYKGEHTINPLTDLRPVCANCHRMLHAKRPPLSIEELKGIIEDGKIA